MTLEHQNHPRSKQIKYYLVSLIQQYIVSKQILYRKKTRKWHPPKTQTHKIGKCLLKTRLFFKDLKCNPLLPEMLFLWTVKGNTHITAPSVTAGGQMVAY